MQGISSGGEFPSVMIFLVESAPRNLRGYLGSWAYFGVQLGVFLGIIDILFILYEMDFASLEKWGWRILFFIGGIIGLIGLILRSKVSETPLYQETERFGEVQKMPLMEVFKVHKKEMFKAFGIALLDAVGYNTIFIFATSFLIHMVHLTMSQVFIINGSTVLVSLIFVPVAGMFSEIIGRKKLAIGAALALLILSCPLYFILLQASFAVALVIQILFGVILVMYLAPVPSLIAEIFPTPIRMTAFGISYNCAIGFFGGMTPWLLIMMLKFTRIPLLPGIYLAIAACIAIFFLMKVKDTERLSEHMEKDESN